MTQDCTDWPPHSTTRLGEDTLWPAGSSSMFRRPHAKIWGCGVRRAAERPQARARLGQKREAPNPHPRGGGRLTSMAVRWRTGLMFWGTM